MDEQIIKITTEQDIEVVNAEIIENKVVAEESAQYVAAEEIEESIEVEDTEEIVIEVDEAIGWIAGDTANHYSLTGRNDPNQHEIKAITGLSEELDEIKKLKTVYSDKVNVANYYKWSDAAYDEHGYFVSIVPNTSTIKICDGSDIFGVSIDRAGFIGGQSELVPRDNSYGLIATSGLVDVRCQLDVIVGDHVVSNKYGYAEKSDSNYGYKVLARENKNGVEYAVIMLGTQADVVDALGIDVKYIESRVKTNEQNIVSAINVANQAYNKSAESANVSEEALKNALEALLNSEEAIGDVENMNEVLESTSAIAAQARAIAESAATSAESMRDTAVKEANSALADTAELRKKFAGMEKQITDIDGRVTIVTKKTTENGTAISGIQSKADEESARIDLLTSWQSDTKTAMARIEQKADENGAYIRSTVSNMDKYSVGPYSQAYGFTLEQAQSVLEDGMIYTPTTHKDLEAGTEFHKEVYKYSNDDGETTQEYKREFTPGYLYQWCDIGNAGNGFGWDTVGESPSVIFSTEKPIANDIIQYWYTNGEPTDATYEPYTLYKWSTYVTKDEEGQDFQKSEWISVATLAKNSLNRAVSQIRQDANSIAFEVTSPQGGFAGMKAELDGISGKVNSVASWPTGKGTHNMAIFEQKADADNPHMVLAVVRDVGGESKVEELGGAKIVMSDDATLGSYIQLDADRVNFGNNVSITNTGNDVMNVADKFIVSRDGSVRLDGNITWRASSSPTQVVYCSAYITKPENNTAWSSFDEEDEAGWHQKFISGSDYYGSYTYDGGATWGEPVQIIGVDGDDANVNYLNVFNALTNNGTKHGCFTGVNGELYINAQYIKSGIIGSNLVLAGRVVAQNIVADGGTIGGFTIGSTGNGSFGLYLCNGDKTLGSDESIFLSTTNICGTMSFPAYGDISLEDADGNLLVDIDENTLVFYDVIKTNEITRDDWRMTIGRNFGVASDGFVYASNVCLSGEITATSGEIGGFTIKPDRISKGINISAEDEDYIEEVISDGDILLASKDKRCGMPIAGSEPGEYWSLIVGPNFGVTSNGELYASAGKIGSLNINSGGIGIENSDGSNTYITSTAIYGQSGCIAGWQFSNHGILHYYTIPASGVPNYTATAASSGVLYTKFLPDKLVTQEKLTGNTSAVQQYIEWDTLTTTNLTSDARLKNNIEILSDKYDVFFDMLQPKRYKYNDGTSGRYHTGYIAQEVVDALDDAGLSTSDFAAVMLRYPGTDSEKWQLRRDEFVSLNTWQIQKLKARVAELEAKIATLV